MNNLDANYKKNNEVVIILLFTNSEFKEFDGVNFGSITKNIK